MVPVTSKWIELSAWQYRNAGSKKERAEIVRWVFLRGAKVHRRGREALEALALLLGVSAARLAREAKLNELKRELNRWRRGKGKKPDVLNSALEEIMRAAEEAAGGAAERKKLTVGELYQLLRLDPEKGEKPLIWPGRCR